MIERVLVIVCFGISILFMLLVLINWMGESLHAEGRFENVRRARHTELGRSIWNIVAPHARRGPE